MRKNNSKKGEELQAMQARAEREQAEFDRLYISSAEVLELLGVSRVALLMAYRNNRIPSPIRTFARANTGSLWKRDTLMPYLKDWYMRLHGEELQYDTNS